MRKIKKLVATLLAATMVMAMGVTAFAAGTTYNVSTTLYKNESCTSVSIQFQLTDLINMVLIQIGQQRGADQEYGQDNVAQKALVTPKEDGTYSVTLQWALYDYLDAVQFYKQNEMSEEMQPKDLTIQQWYLRSNRRWSLLSDHPHESGTTGRIIYKVQ